MWQWGRVFEYRPAQMVENNGFHAHIRHRLAYEVNFGILPKEEDTDELGPDPIII